MSKTPTIIQIEPESELGRLLDSVAESDVLLEMEGDRFRVARLDAPAAVGPAHRRRRLAPERVLNIIGLGASAHGSDIARHKDEYVADAADRRE